MRRHLQLGGDWNAQPANPDRYRPAWLARRARLAIRHAGPGAYGNIDYELSDCLVSNLYRVETASDHDAVLWTVHDAHRARQLKGGTYNLLHGRHPQVIEDELRWLFGTYDLDYLLLQEAAGYHKAITAAGLVVTGWNDTPGKARNIIATRRGLTVDHPRLHRLSDRGWPLGSSGRWHDPLWATGARLDGWLRVVSVHLSNYERGYWHARAYRQAMRRLRRYVTRRRRTLSE